jgi:hypothetical protein
MRGKGFLRGCWVMMSAIAMGFDLGSRRERMMSAIATGHHGMEGEREDDVCVSNSGPEDDGVCDSNGVRSGQQEREDDVCVSNGSREDDVCESKGVLIETRRAVRWV